MSHFDKKYSNGEITVFWKPEICIHSGHCARTLPAVFNPRQTPWVHIDGATTEEIIKTVEGCPSGALSYKYDSTNTAD